MLYEVITLVPSFQAPCQGACFDCHPRIDDVLAPGPQAPARGRARHFPAAVELVVVEALFLLPELCFPIGPLRPSYNFV